MLALVTKSDFQILDCLVDGMQPFAVIYSDMNRDRGLRVSATELSEQIATLVSRRWLSASRYDDDASGGVYRPIERVAARELASAYSALPVALSEAIEYDEVGYYFALTDLGRSAWRAYSDVFVDRAHLKDEVWSLDEDSDRRTVRIVAANETVARRLVSVWKKWRRPSRIIANSLRERQLARATIAKHGEFRDAWEITFSFQDE